MDRRPRLPSLAFVALVALAVGPGLASAHEVTGSRFDAPIPLPLLFVGAGATVALTALGLAVAAGGGASADRRSDVRPPVGSLPSRLGTVPPRVARPLCAAARGAFLVAVVAVLVAGVVGRQVAAGNVATLFTWPVWFRGVALVAVVSGSPWRILSPWRTAYRALVRLEGRRIAVLGTAPAALGAWPALVGFLALVGVVENLTVVPRSPRLTAAVVAAYALAMVGGAVLFGPSWLRRADPLGVLYRLLGRVAVVDVSRTDDGGYDVGLRPPWRGCLSPVASGSLVAFVVAVVYTVSFDGFTGTRRFRSLRLAARELLGTGAGASVLLYALGLAGFVGVFALACRLADRFGSPDERGPSAICRFAPTVLPIAAAYEVAHNYPYVLRNLGRLLVVAARPVAPVGPIDPLGWLSLPAFWASQVALVVVGHVVAVVAAHAVAVDRYGSVAAARRGHLPLVVLMVGYTVLSLWIVSRPVVR